MRVQSLLRMDADLKRLLAYFESTAGAEADLSFAVFARCWATFASAGDVATTRDAGGRGAGAGAGRATAPFSSHVGSDGAHMVAADSFSHIHEQRPAHRSREAFTQQLFGTALSLMHQAATAPLRVGAVYATYALHATQPDVPLHPGSAFDDLDVSVAAMRGSPESLLPVSIRVGPRDWQVMSRLASSERAAARRAAELAATGGRTLSAQGRSRLGDVCIVLKRLYRAGALRFCSYPGPVGFDGIAGLARGEVYGPHRVWWGRPAQVAAADPGFHSVIAGNVATDTTSHASDAPPRVDWARLESLSRSASSGEVPPAKLASVLRAALEPGSWVSPGRTLLARLLDSPAPVADPDELASEDYTALLSDVVPPMLGARALPSVAARRPRVDISVGSGPTAIATPLASSFRWWSTPAAAAPISVESDAVSPLASDGAAAGRREEISSEPVRRAAEDEAIAAELAALSSAALEAAEKEPGEEGQRDAPPAVAAAAEDEKMARELAALSQGVVDGGTAAGQKRQRVAKAAQPRQRRKARQSASPAKRRAPSAPRPRQTRATRASSRGRSRASSRGGGGGGAGAGAGAAAPPTVADESSASASARAQEVTAALDEDEELLKALAEQLRAMSS